MNDVVNGVERVSESVYQLSVVMGSDRDNDYHVSIGKWLDHSGHAFPSGVDDFDRHWWDEDHQAVWLVRRFTNGGRI